MLLPRAKSMRSSVLLTGWNRGRSSDYGDAKMTDPIEEMFAREGVLPSIRSTNWREVVITPALLYAIMLMVSRGELRVHTIRIDDVNVAVSFEPIDQE
jgi:hypothetical protein